MSTVCCCILSWRGSEVLRRTLMTYQNQNMFAHFDQTLVLLQEATTEDIAVVEEFGLPYQTTQENLGIYGGVQMLAQNAATTHLLLLENDCPLIESQDEIVRQLALAKKRLEEETVHVYRLRHRWHPGDKFDTIRKYNRYHLCPEERLSFSKLIRKFLRPSKWHKLIGTAVYVHQHPDQFYEASLIKAMPEGDYIIDSSVMPWTNQSILCKRRWLLDVILPYVEAHPSHRTIEGAQNIENSLNCKWWQQQHFKIGVGLGLFSHQRMQ